MTKARGWLNIQIITLIHMNRRFIGAIAFAFVLLFACSASGQESEQSLKTADTAIEIKASGGKLILESLGFPGTTAGQRWVREPVPIPLPDHVFAENSSKPVHWNFRGMQATTNAGEVIWEFACADPKLDLRSIWRAQSGPGPIEHHLEIINRSGQPIEVPLVPSLALAIKAAKGHALENWWVEKGSGRPSDIGTHREEIHDGYTFAGRSTPYAEAPEMIPWISIEDTVEEQGIYLGIEFSGRVGFDITAAGDPLMIKIVAGLDSSDKSFRSRLANGETFVTPMVFIGSHRGSLDAGANQLHRFVEHHLRPAIADGRYPLVVNNSWGSGMAVDEKLARKMIDDAATLEVEMFHIDAGWFRGVGDWHPDPRKFPRGLGPVSDYVHSKNMLFGLWVGWTQGGTDVRDSETLAVNNPNQRNWFTHDYPPSWKPSDFTGAPVCLGTQPARDWCLNELRRLVASAKLDLLEHDQIMIVDRCDRTNHEHTASRADIAYHATRGYYAVYDQLRAEHPRLLFEDCVNGGRTVDFGIARRTHYISITDTYDPLSNRRAFYDASYPLPPSMCECYIENKPGPTLDTFKSMLRSGMMGWCTLMCDTSAWSPEQHTAARRQIQIYKQWIRPLINRGDLYHISSRPDESRWDAMEYFDHRTNQGIVFVFRGNKAIETKHFFKLAGLDRDASYEVWSEDGSMPRANVPGSTLQSQGIEPELRAPGTSDLIYLQAR